MEKEPKRDREKRQAEGFLVGLVEFDRVECVTPDPPDIRVWHGGSPVLSLELTEYHGDETGVLTTIRWRDRLWPKIDALRRADTSQRGFYGQVVFLEQNLPGMRNRQADQFASELVSLAGRFARSMSFDEQRKVSFAPRGGVADFAALAPYWQMVPKEDWPMISGQINSITFTKQNTIHWLHWTCPQSDMGYSTVATSAFRQILEEKESKVRQALGDPRRFPSNAAIWLVLITDSLNDMTSHIFPSTKGDAQEILEEVRSTGYDFTASPFDATWLYSDFTKAKMRLDVPLSTR